MASQKLNKGLGGSINEIKARKAKVKLSKEDSLKLNLQQWTSFKESVKTETEKWKKIITKKTTGVALGLTGNWTNLAYQDIGPR